MLAAGNDYDVAAIFHSICPDGLYFNNCAEPQQGAYMTLQELWMVVVRRWKLVAIVTLVCVLACGGYLMLTKKMTSYSADAYIVGNSQTAYVSGLATDEARQLSEAGEPALKGVAVTAKADTASFTVTVTATGADGDACIDAANLVAGAANDAAIESYSDWEAPYYGTVSEAKTATVVGSGSSLKYLFVALLAGLFVGICIVVVLDVAKRPVKTPEGVQDAVELPVLEILPAKSGERLLANVRFAATAAAGEGDGSGDPVVVSSVLVVPAGDAEAADAAAKLLEASAIDEGAKLEVSCGSPLSEGMGAAYASRDVDAVVVAVRQWVDTLPQLESTVAELRLAGATLAGVAFAKGKLS